MNFIEPILHRARSNPNAPALLLPNSLVRYGQIDAITHTIATNLERAGVAPGDLIVVGLGRKELAIYVTIALARLGAISVAMNASPTAPRDWAASLGCKAVCRSDTDPVFEGVSSIPFDPAWVSVPPRPGPPPRAVSGNEVFRIALSSGTTGNAKAIPWTHAGAAQRIIGHQFGAPTKAGDRMLFLSNLNTGFGFNACFNQLFMGGAIVPAAVEAFVEFAASVERYRINETILSAYDISRLLSSAPAELPPGIAKTSAVFAGAALAESYWRKAAHLFSGVVLSNYGATETGPTAFGDHALFQQYPDAVGRVLPWVRIEAVDENDQPLPPGEQGILRVRAPGMAAGYFHDEAATAEAFRHGWFYPGDVGLVSGDGIVRLMGRSDDLLNLGGVKLAPGTIERALADAVNVRDVAAAAVRGPNGEIGVGVGIVASAPVDGDELGARCRAVVPNFLAYFIVQLEAIPRNDAGKIVRRDLAARLQAALKSKS